MSVCVFLQNMIQLIRHKFVSNFSPIFFDVIGSGVVNTVNAVDMSRESFQQNLPCIVFPQKLDIKWKIVNVWGIEAGQLIMKSSLGFNIRNNFLKNFCKTTNKLYVKPLQLKK